MTINTAQIICVGTEILIGDIVNTNAAYLSRQLASLGISQYRQSAVGDNEERLADEIKRALPECDLLILTGGLGPTYDDMTRVAVAKALGKKLVYHEELFEKIKQYFENRGKQTPESNKSQAYLIDGAKALENAHGTAPGQIIEGDKTIVLLPGPPTELRLMWENELKEKIAARCGKALVSHNINIVGIGESELEIKLGELMKNATNPTVAPYCSPGEVRLRVTASADDRDTAASMCNDMIRKIFNTELAPYIYGLDTNLPEAVVRTLIKQDKSITFAESCTGGLLAKMLTDIPGASKVFEGSMVSYSDDAKARTLGLGPDVVVSKGAVSHEVATKMAKAIRSKFHTDVGVGVTGFAGPEGGKTPDKPVGLVYIAVSISGEMLVKKFLFGADNSRDKIRELAAANAFAMVLEMLLKP